MPIVISRTGELNPQVASTVTQEQRDALWAAFVTGWVKKNEDKFTEMLTKPEAAPSGSL
jgi:hypothetical protein